MVKLVSRFAESTANHIGHHLHWDQQSDPADPTCKKVINLSPVRRLMNRIRQLINTAKRLLSLIVTTLIVLNYEIPTPMKVATLPWPFYVCFPFDAITRCAGPEIQIGYKSK